MRIPLIQQSRMVVPEWQRYAESLRTYLERERVTPEDVALVLGVCDATARSEIEN